MVFLWAGIEFTQFAFNRTSELAELPLWLIHVAWPVTGLTWLVFLGERMLDDIDIMRGRDVTGAALAPGMAALILFGMFFGLLALRVPVAFALGLAALPILLIEPRLSAYTLVQETFNAYNSFILLAVPFYLLAANLMNVGGITDRLVRLSRALVGHMPGALAQVNVVLSIFFAGISGLVDCRCRQPVEDLHRGAAQGRLRRQLLGRDHRGVRGAGGDHPAVDPDDRLGRRADRVDRRAVPRRRDPGTC